MAKSVKWNLTVSIEGAPTLTSSENTTTDAVDAVSVAIDATKSKTAEIQPGKLSEVKFLYIKLKESDLYGKVKYKFNDGTNDSSEVTLDKDHFLTSGELVKLFGIAPNKMTITNSHATMAANVEVVVARTAAL